MVPGTATNSYRTKSGYLISYFTTCSRLCMPGEAIGKRYIGMCDKNGNPRTNCPGEDPAMAIQAHDLNMAPVYKGYRAFLGRTGASQAGYLLQDNNDKNIQSQTYFVIGQFVLASSLVKQPPRKMIADYSITKPYLMESGFPFQSWIVVDHRQYGTELDCKYQWAHEGHH